jgi:hypothetical protein
MSASRRDHPSEFIDSRNDADAMLVLVYASILESMSVEE